MTKCESIMAWVTHLFTVVQCQPHGEVEENKSYEFEYLLCQCVQGLIAHMKSIYGMHLSFLISLITLLGFSSTSEWWLGRRRLLKTLKCDVVQSNWETKVLQTTILLILCDIRTIRTLTNNWLTIARNRVLALARIENISQWCFPLLVDLTGNVGFCGWGH